MLINYNSKLAIFRINWQSDLITYLPSTVLTLRLRHLLCHAPASVLLSDRILQLKIIPVIHSFLVLKIKLETQHETSSTALYASACAVRVLAYVIPL